MLKLLSWLQPRLIRDSSSDRRPSWTLTLGIPTVVLLTLWFVLGGIRVQVGDTIVTTATKSGSDYALALAPWLTFIAQRGWRQRATSPGAPADPVQTSAP